MGKNHGKHGKRTEVAKVTSIMRKAQDALDKEKASGKKHK